MLLPPRDVCGRSLQLLGRGRQLLQPTATPSRSCPELARLSGPSPARLEPVEPPCEPDATDGLGLGLGSGLGLGLGSGLGLGLGLGLGQQAGQARRATEI